MRTDFEMIVRIADKMGADVRELVPLGPGPRADMGQTRGAQSGEADRHAVWLTANNMEPRLSPFDPGAILDEIQRLVPGYDLMRLQLLSGNDQHLSPAARPGTPRAWCRSPAAATWCCRPTTRFLPRERWDATPRCSTTCNRIEAATVPGPERIGLRPTEPGDQRETLNHLTNFEVFLLLSVLKVAVVLVITLMGVAYTVLLERKVIGYMQNRWGLCEWGRLGCCSRWSTARSCS